MSIYDRYNNPVLHRPVEPKLVAGSTAHTTAAASRTSSGRCRLWCRGDRTTGRFDRSSAPTASTPRSAISRSGLARSAPILDTLGPDGAVHVVTTH